MTVEGAAPAVSHQFLQLFHKLSKTRKSRFHRSGLLHIHAGITQHLYARRAARGEDEGVRHRRFAQATRSSCHPGQPRSGVIRGPWATGAKRTSGPRLALRLAGVTKSERGGARSLADSLAVAIRRWATLRNLFSCRAEHLVDGAMRRIDGGVLIHPFRCT